MGGVGGEGMETSFLRLGSDKRGVFGINHVGTADSFYRLVTCPKISFNLNESSRIH